MSEANLPDAAYQVIEFWFGELTSKDWWRKDPELDQLIKNRFSQLHQSACQAELFTWRKHAQGRLAEILILDQFSRNIFREQPKAFATDALALALAQEAIVHGLDKQLPNAQRAFLYLPYMHSESKAIHNVAIELFSQPGLEDNLAFELKHKVIIDQFGRYPHRNSILGRPSTEEELAFLAQPNSSF